MRCYGPCQAKPTVTAVCGNVAGCNFSCAELTYHSHLPDRPGDKTKAKWLIKCLLTEQKAVGSSPAILCSARAAMPFDTAVHGAKKVRSRISLKPENFAKQHLLICCVVLTSPSSCSRLHMVITRRIKHKIFISTKLQHVKILQYMLQNWHQMLQLRRSIFNSFDCR